MSRLRAPRKVSLKQSLSRSDGGGARPACRVLAGSLALDTHSHAQDFARRLLDRIIREVDIAAQPPVPPERQQPASPPVAAR
jgi:hypothetical protein